MLRHTRSRCVSTGVATSHAQQNAYHSTAQSSAHGRSGPTITDSTPGAATNRPSADFQNRFNTHSPPRPPQTPAPSFKRPNRKCPGPTFSAAPGPHAPGHFRLSHSVSRGLAAPRHFSRSTSHPCAGPVAHRGSLFQNPGHQRICATVERAPERSAMLGFLGKSETPRPFAIVVQSAPH